MSVKKAKIGESVKECNFERVRRFTRHFSFRKLLRSHAWLNEKDEKVLERLLIGYAEQYEWVPQHIPKEQIIRYLAHLDFILDIADGVIVPCSNGKVHFVRK